MVKPQKTPANVVSAGDLAVVVANHADLPVVATCPACSEIERMVETEVLLGALVNRPELPCMTRCPFCNDKSWVVGIEVLDDQVRLAQQVDVSSYDEREAPPEPVEPDASPTLGPPPPLPPLPDPRYAPEDEGEEDLPAAWTQE